MPQPATPDPRTIALDRLRTTLLSVTVQDLRQAARLWNWPVKGTAKADIIAQLVEHLTDAAEMGPVFQGLSTIQQQAMIWLAHLGRSDDQTEALRTVIGLAEGRDISKSMATRVMSELRQRLLLVVDAYQGIHIPDIYSEWLPRSHAPGQALRAQPADVEAAFSAEELDRHVEHLLSNIQADRPQVDAILQGGGGQARPPSGTPRGMPIIAAHAGIVTDAMLARWGYVERAEQNLARTLLSAMIAGNLCLVREAGLDLRLLPNTAAMEQWRDLSPELRRASLRYWWLSSGQVGTSPQARAPQVTWDELDMVLRGQPEYSLRQGMDWLTREQLDAQVRAMRAWLVQLLGAFERDVWYSISRLLELIYNLHRDLFFWTPYYVGWVWYDSDTRLDTHQISQRVWNDTFGALVEAWLTGPARWFGLAQIAMENGQPVGFSLPSAVANAPVSQLAQDTLRFTADGTLVLRNTWRAGELRQRIRRIATEVARTLETTTYALDTTAFRETLRGGQSADQIIQGFAEVGFPLPKEISHTLAEWQGRMGRHQLYDNLGVIEFGDDITLAELQATTALGHTEFYPISPRCIVVLRPDSLPALVDELRRKGYTPQVIS